MPTLMTRRLLICLLAAICGSTARADAAEPEFSDVFPAGLGGVRRHRIPGVVVSTAGTVLAYCEARRNGAADWGEIEVHLRRSTDGGLTWLPPQHIAHHGPRLEGHPHQKPDAAAEQTVNNPLAIVDRPSGDIVFLYCVNYERCFVMRSRDDGLTWSSPVDITTAFEPFRRHRDWKVLATGPGHGIQLAGGRLVVPVWLAYGRPGAHAPSVAATIWSDDHGLTWQAGDLAIPDTPPWRDPNESIAALTSDGRVLLVTRSVSAPNRKLLTFSKDGASGWSRPEFHPDLREPVCMAGLVAHPDGALVLSCPDTVGTDKEGKEVPAGRGRRERLAVRVSRDDGRTWSPARVLEARSSAYSDLAVLPDGRVLCLHESGDAIRMARFPLTWVTDGK